MRLININSFLFILVLFLTSPTANAQISVAGIFSNNMVLQQNAEVSIWGWANLGDTILVTGSWNNKTVKTVTDDNNKWMTKLSTPAAKTDGTSYTVTISGTNTIILSNILIGEVWLLSGQSNMEMQLSGWSDAPIEGSAAAINTANFPNIRLMTVNKKSSSSPVSDIQNNLNNQWVKCSPATAGNFSAVGFFFGRELHQNLNIPIGLVNSSWGGSSCETWAEKSSLDFVSEYANNGPWQSQNSDDNQTATVLYNGMIAPIVPFNFAGVCWYQGETNVGRSEQLTELFPAMIEGWRNVFQKENLPFYFVQLAPWGAYGDGSLPVFWEAQANTLKLHDTEMAETLDCGNVENIHPARKEPIGNRLAKKALANVYGQNNLVFAGPRYDSLKIEDNKIRVYFSHTGSGLKAANSTLQNFEIAGSNNIYYAANAEIEDNEVVVSASQVSNPKNVRYAWNKNATASLYNNEDFPAPPFRSNPPEYIQTVKTKLLIGSELINEGENVEIRWTTVGANSIQLDNKTVGSSGILNLTPDTTTTFKLTAENGKESSSQEKTVYVIPEKFNSWAKHKLVSASSNRTDYDPEFAVDEKNNTGWSSNYTNNEWITIDLGESVPINLVILHWGTFYGKTYQLQVSDDNINWNTIFEENQGNGEIDFLTIQDAVGRYLRFQGVARSGSRGYDINEFQVFSTEKRAIGTLLDKNSEILRGTPMVLAKSQIESVEFATDIKNWETIKNNGFNTIRVCWVDPWYSDRKADCWSVAEVLPYFDKCIQNATESGMNIIINYHNVGAQQEFDTDYLFQAESVFWDSIAPRYKNNDLVYYEIANEPTFQIGDYLKPAFKQNLLGIYSKIRSLAPERQILMFSFNQISNELIDVVEDYKNELDWSKTSVAYHMYGSTTSQPVQILMAYHRVICTEWNYDFVSNREGYEYIKQVDGFKENAETLENIESGWIDWRDWNDTTLNELLDTLIFDARQKNYWWGKTVTGLKVSGVKIHPNKTELKSKKTKQLFAFVSPALAENQEIKWSSSNNEYVTVNAIGLITAKASQTKTATVTAKSIDGNYTATCEVKVFGPEKKGAYSDGVPHKIPGEINPTHYDLGGEGIGYHDLDNKNNGNGIRPDEGVDTEFRLETGSIGGIQNGEWLEYTIDVEEEGNYTLAILFASPAQYGKFHIEIDETDITGQVFAKASGSFNVFIATTLENITLTKGEHIIRFFFDFAYYNMGTISIAKENTSNISSTQTNTSIELFPNPVKDELFISGDQTQICYLLQTINGQTIQSGYFSEKTSINTSFLPQGHYLISFSGKDFFITKKLAKL